MRSAQIARIDVDDIDLGLAWNAPEDAPIIAINQTLGCRVVAETVEYVEQR